VKKLLLVAIALMMTLGMVPARASITAQFQGQVCNTYYNPAHTKAEQVCAKIGSNAANEYWAQVNASNVTGKNEAYSNMVTRVRFWSTNDGVNYCQGYDDGGCGPEGGGEVENASEPDIPYSDATAHYNRDQHHCFVHAYVLVIIYWDSSSQLQSRAEFNSGVVNTQPYCD